MPSSLRGDIVDAHGHAIIATQDAVILGRRSYDEWSEFWPGPGSQIEPFASFINKVPKYVATSTPLGREWENTTAIEGDLIPFVQDLKNSAGGDVGVHASISLSAATGRSGSGRAVEKLSWTTPATLIPWPRS